MADDASRLNNLRLEPTYGRATGYASGKGTWGARIMGVCLNLAGDMVLGASALAGLAAILLTVLLLAALSHPILATAGILLIAGALAK
jgi:hypothetical protein